jgi:hypothetical protein
MRQSGVRVLVGSNGLEPVECAIQRTLSVVGEDKDTHRDSRGWVRTPFLCYAGAATSFSSSLFHLACFTDRPPLTVLSGLVSAKASELLFRPKTLALAGTDPIARVEKTDVAVAIAGIAESPGVTRSNL